MGHALCDAMGLNDQAAGGRARGSRSVRRAGIGCEMNQALAVNHFRAAAMAGYVPRTASRRRRGLAQVEQPDATAADWYRKAAEAGVVQAQSSMARAHAGQGRAPGREPRATGSCARPTRATPTAEPARALLPGRALRRAHDDAEAARWYMRAADSGDADAQAELGAMYKEGRLPRRTAALYRP